MPDKILTEAIQHFDEGVDELAVLVNEVRGLKRWRIVFLGFILVIAGTAGVYGYVLHRLENDRVEGCRGRNQTFSNLFDFIELQVDSDRGHEFVEGMRAASVMDCDRDGDTADDLGLRSG